MSHPSQQRSHEGDAYNPVPGSDSTTATTITTTSRAEEDFDDESSSSSRVQPLQPKVHLPSSRSSSSILPLLPPSSSKESYQTSKSYSNALPLTSTMMTASSTTNTMNTTHTTGTGSSYHTSMAPSSTDRSLSLSLSPSGTPGRQGAPDSGEERSDEELEGQEEDVYAPLQDEDEDDSGEYDKTIRQEEAEHEQKQRRAKHNPEPGSEEKIEGQDTDITENIDGSHEPLDPVRINRLAHAMGMVVPFLGGGGRSTYLSPGFASTSASRSKSASTSALDSQHSHSHACASTYTSASPSTSKPYRSLSSRIGSGADSKARASEDGHSLHGNDRRQRQRQIQRKPSAMSAALGWTSRSSVDSHSVHADVNGHGDDVQSGLSASAVGSAMSGQFRKTNFRNWDGPGHGIGADGEGYRDGDGQRDERRWLITVVPPDEMFRPTPTTITMAGRHENGSRSTGTDRIPSPSVKSPEQKPSNSNSKEHRRWKAGRLLPLQRDFGTMIHSITKEWNLPTGVGMEIFVVSLALSSIGEGDSGKQIQGPGQGDGERDLDIEDGSLIGNDAWGILWGKLDTVNRQSTKPTVMDADADYPRTDAISPTTDRPSPAKSTRGGLRPLLTSSYSLSDHLSFPPSTSDDPNEYLTPTHTQLTFHDSFKIAGGAIMASPQSSIAPSASVSQLGSPTRFAIQAQPQTEKQRNTQHSHVLRSNSQLTFDTMASSSMGEAGSVIVGKIQFDFDHEKAEWYPSWLRRRESSATVTNGLRELKLGYPQNDDERLKGYQKKTNKDQENEQELQVDLNDLLPDDDEDEFARLRAQRRTGHRHDGKYGIQDIGTNDILQPNVRESDLVASHSDVGADGDDVAEVIDLLRWSDLKTTAGQGLASPIDFVNSSMRDQQDSPLTTPMTEDNPKTDEAHGLGVGLVDGKRGSSLVMSERLDDLEKAIRSLTPRELRLSLYHRLSIPADEDDEPISSNEKSVVEGNYSEWSVSKPAEVPGIKAAPPSINHPSSSSAWPAVPFLKTPEIDQIATFPSNSTHLLVPRDPWTPRSMPDGAAPQPISPESMMRMEYVNVPGQSPKITSGGLNQGWKPQRPIRPPTPNMEDIEETHRSNTITLGARPPKDAILSTINLLSSPPLRSTSLSKKTSQKKLKGKNEGQGDAGSSGAGAAHGKTGKVNKFFARRKSSSAGSKAKVVEDSGKGNTVSSNAADGAQSRPDIPLRRERTAEVVRKVTNAINDPLPPIPSARPGDYSVCEKQGDDKSFSVLGGRGPTNGNPVDLGSPPLSPSVPLSSPKSDKMGGTSGGLGKFFKGTFGPFGGNHKRTSSTHSGNEGHPPTSPAGTQNHTGGRSSSHLPVRDRVTSRPSPPTSPSPRHLNSISIISTNSPKSPSASSIRRKPVPTAEEALVMLPRDSSISSNMAAEFVLENPPTGKTKGGSGVGNLKGNGNGKANGSDRGKGNAQVVQSRTANSAKRI